MEQKKQLHSGEWNGTHPITLLRNGTFYSISRDGHQPIERPEFDGYYIKGNNSNKVNIQTQ